MKTARSASLLVILFIGTLAIIFAFQYNGLVSKMLQIEDKDLLIAYSSQLQVYSGLIASCVTGLVGILATTEKTPPTPPTPVKVEVDKVEVSP